MATDRNRRLTPIIIKSRHFTANENEDSANNITTAASSAKSKRNHVEFSNRVDQTTNGQRRESFFQYYLRRLSSSASGGGNLLSVARARPPSSNNISTTTTTCFSLATPNPSSSVALDLYSARQSSLSDDSLKNGANDADDETNHGDKRRIGDKRLQAPRLSLLGRPIMYRSPRNRNVIYRIHQIRLYNFLERPRGFLAIFYHLSM